MTEIQWANLKASELRELANQDALVITPIGSIEQPGGAVGWRDQLLSTPVPSSPLRSLTRGIAGGKWLI